MRVEGNTLSRGVPVHEAIEDRVGNGWVADKLVPMLDWELACHHGRVAAMAILHHLQQVALLLSSHRGKSPVVEDQKLDPRMVGSSSSA